MLIGGATGSGKTTTLPRWSTRSTGVTPGTSSPSKIRSSTSTRTSVAIEQVEVGVDAPDFPTALRAAVRQAPDVLVIGEMRDHESMRIALAAAETGHLVFSSVHTLDVASSVGRICDSFPNERQNTIRQELSWALAAVMTQTLIPLAAKGRVPAAELLMIELRRPAAHSQERAAAPASGDHDHPQAGFVHARGVAGEAGQDRRNHDRRSAVTLTASGRNRDAPEVASKEAS